MPARKRTRKQISSAQMTGDRGIALIHTIVSEMGFVWNPTTLESGIDGYIEIRDQGTWETTNFIIQVQSKATGRSFDAETATGFAYHCDERDLDYWLSGNAPVILVCSRPSTKEAYWVSIKNYFRGPATRASRTIHFSKTKNKFDASARDALVTLAVPGDSGTYLVSPPKRETLYSNLLRVKSFAPTIYVANTEYRSRGEVWNALDAMGAQVGAEWVLRSGQIKSFQDLGERPWTEICDQGTLDPLETSLWADTDDADFLNEFLELLNRSLEQKLMPDVHFKPSRGYFYFAPTPNLKPRRLRYRSLAKNAERLVFQGYPKRGKPEEISYYRHSAFSGKFVRHDREWYLEITPRQQNLWVNSGSGNLPSV